MTDSALVSSLLSMKRELLLTSDGPHTIIIPYTYITYHSIHGAMQESHPVFIEAGLEYALLQFLEVNDSYIRVFETGSGTGLNTLLSFAEAKEVERNLYY